MKSVARRPLAGLLAATAIGAFNDNAWKLAVALLVMRPLEASLAGAELESAAQEATARAFVVFTVPFVLLSLVAGSIADRFEKRALIVALKVLEVAILGLGAAALAPAEPSSFALLGVLALMGAHSAFFGPVKYGVLPEIVPHARLSAANGALELATMLAIIGGSALGPWILATAGDRAWLAPAFLALLAALGAFAARALPRTAAARSGVGVVIAARDGWKALRSDRALRLALFGLALFWFVAAGLGQVLFAFAKTSLGLGETYAGAPLAVLGAGIGAGAFFAGKLSARQVEIGLAPLGGIALTLGAGTLALVQLGLAPTLVLLFVLGAAAGFVVVPLNALLQWRAPVQSRGAVLGIANTAQFAAMLAAGLLAGAAAHAGASPRALFGGFAIVLVAGSAWALRIAPEAALRAALVVLTHTLYRLRVVDRHHVPETGGALLVPNHVTMVDGLWLLASTDREIRFVVDQEWYEKRWLKPFLVALNAIPIAASGGPRVILRALRDAGKHLEAGDLVCIFAEGQLTRTGTLQPFRRGMERIAKGRGAPIVPVYLGNAWGSIFSGSRGRFVWKLPSRLPYPVTVMFGAPLADTTPILDVRRAVEELGERFWRERSRSREPVQRGFVRSVRRAPWKFAIHDAQRGSLSRAKLLATSVALARALRERWSDQQNVGILLPPSIAGVASNVAAALAGRTSVNLNYTSGRAALESAARQAELRTLLTSRAFVEKAKLEVPTGLEIVWLEDVAKEISGLDRLACLARAIAWPMRALERSCGSRAASRIDDAVTIIFSSGSTGEPKGVPVTHAMLDANVSGVAQVIHLEPKDRLFSILPLFHSFGTMATWFAISHGLGTVQHANPLDAAAVGDLVEKQRCTLLIATPTFLSIYLRRCTPAQFGSLRLVLAGAEKLSVELATAFEERFGIRPIEGYGTTECSPVIAVSTPSVRERGVHQSGSRRGTVGQPLPGIALRIVDPDTREPRAAGESGMLLVRGANVMSGYLGKPELSSSVLVDGWYVTGDIAVRDDDGFLRITDRLSRFSKIGGEMVPHGRVEEALHQAAGLHVPTFAVTAVPDAKKGERLAVVHTFDAAKVPELLEKLAKSGLPNLFLPRVDAFLKVEALPMLGTGKLDLKRLKEIAVERLS